MQNSWKEQDKVFSRYGREKGEKYCGYAAAGNTLLDSSILERGYYCATFRSVEQTAMGGCRVSHG